MRPQALANFLTACDTVAILYSAGGSLEMPARQWRNRAARSSRFRYAIFDTFGVYKLVYSPCLVTAKWAASGQAATWNA